MQESISSNILELIKWNFCQKHFFRVQEKSECNNELV